MGSQAPINSDRSRVSWTPTMECYFIDLMLDHMHRGNRIGHTFNKQAWIDMITVFNAKFRSQYDKDVLKSRYTSLWKQFNDIKNLLEHNGFSWDDSQQMVVADDYAWDAYVKAHPDAQYYRNKAVMNFNDLCLIYAYTAADGRYSRSSHDIDFEDDIQGAFLGERFSLLSGGKEDQTPTGSNCLKAFWTLLMDHYFIDLLLDQVLRGNRVGHAITTSAWADMVALFNVKFGCQYVKEDLKNQYKHLSQLYKDVKILLDQSGFSWDETREMVTAEDYVWDSYTKAYPDARSYKFRTVPSYQKLCVIYGKESGNGRDSCTGHNIDLSGEDPISIADSDVSSNVWTPLKVRYLIDLMLKQVHKGLTLNHISSKQAWEDIGLLFCDQFGLQYDKYVLKDQHNSLRKLYDDMKNLLNQSGFSWDENLQMVTARDDMWDAYIKEHPDRKLFRKESKPNYNDLCVIYGDSTSDAKCDQSHHVDFRHDGRNIQVFSNGGSLRTGWTPPMDRCFIDLMLEQIRRGSMEGHKFNKQAWGFMLANFNAKFGTQHKEDVLKIRFNILRKWYNDMKTLLDHSGFAWDEMQQMIIANEDLWDALVKDYPDGHSFKNRTLPNYNDLSLIYGNANTGRRHDPSSHCFQMDDDFLGANVGREKNQAYAAGDSTTNDWTKPMDRYFIHLMVEQVLEGNKVDHTFSRQAWGCMTTSFNERFGLQCDKHVLHSRYLSLMKQYNNISNCLNQKGFLRDEIQQAVTAENGAWRACMKEHPAAAKYKGQGSESFNDLSIIFGNGIQDARSTHLTPEMDFDHNAIELWMNGILGGLQSPDIENEVTYQKKKRHSETPLASACSRKAKITGKGFQEAGRSNTQDRTYNSIESIVEALQGISDMDDELFLDACDLLEDEKNAKAFVRMDIAHRKKWLLRKLRR